ncbi:hypothetical protein J6590_075216 [Homalodisca vitripennis]|nr:hypothetical protein J6590_075216 [Homalodisca vitripennis]
MASNADKPEEIQDSENVIEDPDPQSWSDLAEEITQGTQNWRGTTYQNPQTQYVPIDGHPGVQYYQITPETRAQMGQYINYYPTPEQPAIVQKTTDQLDNSPISEPPKVDTGSRNPKKKKEYIKKAEECKYFKEAHYCPHGLTCHYTHKLREDYSIQTMQYTFDMIIDSSGASNWCLLGFKKRAVKKLKTQASLGGQTIQYLYNLLISS